VNGGAAEAMRFLVALGIDRSRIKTISYGRKCLSILRKLKKPGPKTEGLIS
jgi:hypothetical protein